ncbi:hypothetical protein FD00_GL001671 [Liquorilactobacillus mali KCTC 3596 = DSM 20444]|uniref:Uncharacterized protein n=1 Tax=Liquorilactobacillus mali KCTC 3596 = DSM 20444 TaxID=1046596 RepID=A0A0R2E8S7_9LACO|nr:hypothetical protein FD00_GL001671 [Liquorilactobacillus mali KCTC 3596 = DSM 20444]
MCQLFSSEQSPIFCLKNIRISVVELTFVTAVSPTWIRYQGAFLQFLISLFLYFQYYLC